MNNKRYAFLSRFLILLIATIGIGSASSDTLFPVYSPAELKNSTEIPIKCHGKISDDDLSIILEAAAQKIRTFDSNKYEKVKVTLSIVGGKLRDDVWVDRFLFELEGYRDDKTESWQMEIEHSKNKKNATITRVLGGGTLVPDTYTDIARSIALKNLDEEILNRTPEIVGTSWIIDKPAFVAFKLKDPNSPAHTIVAVDLNNYSIDSVEKNSWQLSFPIYFTITSNPIGADVYLAKHSPELCGPPPYKLSGDFIGKTPFTYKYEYNETFLPYSGLFSLFSFNLSSYEDEFKCITIYRGEGASELSVSIFSEGYLEHVSRNPPTYNISAELKPLEKRDKKAPAFEIVSLIGVLLLIYFFRRRL